MNCPKCSGQMETVTFEDYEVDRCAACGGLWFDMLEKEGLKAVPGSEAIDPGQPAGHADDARAAVNCPVCHTPMIRMADLDQPHIHFESCTVCFGAFFDAGEFRDYKDKTLGDLIRDFVARRR